MISKCARRSSRLNCRNKIVSSIIERARNALTQKAQLQFIMQIGRRALMIRLV